MSDERRRRSGARYRLGRGADRLIKRLLGGYRSLHVLLGGFALLLLVCLGFTVWLLIANADRVVQGVLMDVADRVQQETHREIRHFLGTPDQINRHTLQALRRARVQVADEGGMHALFWDSPREPGQPVSGVYFGARDGSFTGLDANERTWPPAGWRYTTASPATGGRMVYLDADATGSIVGVPTVSEPYDPRSRPWYEQAAGQPDGEPVWTGVYANFDDGSPTLTRAQALRDDDERVLGVAGVDLFLGHLQRFLSGLALGPNGEVFIVQANGDLIGSHAHRTLPSGTADAGAIADARPARFTRAAAAYVTAHHGGFERIGPDVRDTVVLDGEQGYLLLSSKEFGSGLDWVVGVFVPEGDYLETWGVLARRAAPLGLLGVVLSLLTMTVFVHLVVQPLSQLSNSAARIATGDFDLPIAVDCDNEVGDLARAIDDMRCRLRDSFERLTEHKRRAEITLSSISDGVITVNVDGTVRYMNRAAEQLVGQSLEAVRGRAIDAVFDARDERDERDGAAAIPELLQRSTSGAHGLGRSVTVTAGDGRTRTLYCHTAPVIGTNGLHHGVVLNFSDLTGELALRSELAHQATHDSLTGLVNRREFEHRTVAAIERARTGHVQHVLCCIDLDRFKLINDAAGHEAGDEMLCQSARLLEQARREGDTVARLGGDEFGLLLEDCTLDEASVVLERLRARFEAHRFLWKHSSHAIGISAGLSAIGTDSPGKTQVMRDADSACYIAKRGGRNRVHVHRENDGEMTSLRNDRSWIERIGKAFDEERFVLYAQHIVPADPAAESGRHIEILLRMIDDAGKLLSPTQILSAAERYDLATRIDRWVVSGTLDWLLAQDDGDALPDTCSINLSGQSLGDRTMHRFLVAQVERAGVESSRLCFEVTETATIANLSRALALIEALRERGCRFALGDFGSGLSSFAYLKRLPVDYLKIDGLFVRDMLDDPLDFAMVRAIHEVGRTMGMSTVAEHVESDASRQALHGIGVTLA